MLQADLRRAAEYALGRLARELPPSLTYHCLEHTRDDVVPAVERLAAAEGVQGEDLLLLRTAAYYHDLGYIERYEQNELISVRMAREALPSFGYSPAQIDMIASLIMATAMPQRPETLLEQILADADLDVLGREDFPTRDAALRNELAARGQDYTEPAWNASQLQFLQTHRYFTAAARSLRDAGKQRNMALMREKVPLYHAS